MPPPILQDPSALIASLIVNAVLLGALLGTITAWTIHARRLRRQRTDALRTIGMVADQYGTERYRNSTPDPTPGPDETPTSTPTP